MFRHHLVLALAAACLTCGCAATTPIMPAPAAAVPASTAAATEADPSRISAPPLPIAAPGLTPPVDAGAAGPLPFAQPVQRDPRTGQPMADPSLQIPKTCFTQDRSVVGQPIDTPYGPSQQVARDSETVCN